MRQKIKRMTQLMQERFGQPIVSIAPGGLDRRPLRAMRWNRVIEWIARSRPGSIGAPRRGARAAARH